MVNKLGVKNNVYLFTKFTPNSDRGIFYIPRSGVASATDISGEGFLNKCVDEALNTYTADTTNYRIYDDGFIELPLNAGANAENKLLPWDVTYLAVDMCTSFTPPYTFGRAGNPEGDMAHKWLFFFVTNFEIRGGRLRYYVREDKFANYFPNAKITKVNLTQTNIWYAAAHNNGSPYSSSRDYLYTFDYPIDSKGSNKLFEPANTARDIAYDTSRGDISVCFVVKFQSAKSISEEIYDQAVGVINFGMANPGDLADTILSVFGIYESQSGGTAQVSHVYIIPTAWISDVAMPEVFDQKEKFKYAKTKYSEQIIESGEFEAQLKRYSNHEELYYIFNNGNASGTNVANTVYLSGKNIRGFGTPYNYLKLSNFVGQMSISVKTLLTEKEIKITVEGPTGEMLDLTDQFEVEGVANTGTLNAQESVAKWLGVISGIAGGAFQIASGGAGYVSGPLQIGQAINSAFQQKGNGTFVSGGGALWTWRDELYNGKTTQQFTSYDKIGVLYNEVDETKYIDRLNIAGAACDIVYEEFYDIFKADLIKPPFNNNLFFNKNAPFYVSISNAAIDDIPEDAAAEIKAALLAGIRIEVYE